MPFNELRLSIRLPPTKNPEDAKKTLIRILTENPPYGAKVTVKNSVVGHGYNNSQYPPVVKSAID